MNYPWQRGDCAAYVPPFASMTSAARPDFIECTEIGWFGEDVRCRGVATAAPSGGHVIIKARPKKPEAEFRQRNRRLTPALRRCGREKIGLPFVRS